MAASALIAGAAPLAKYFLVPRLGELFPIYRGIVDKQPCFPPDVVCADLPA